LRTVVRAPDRIAATDRTDGDDTLRAVRNGGALRQLAAGLFQDVTDAERRGAAMEEVRRVLAEDPNLAFANYLQGELEDRPLGESPATTGAFAMAFIDAMKRQDRDRLDGLRSMHSGQTELLDVARAFLFGDREAADRTVVWLKSQPRAEPRPIAALRGFIERRFGTKEDDRYRLEVADGAAFLCLIADNDNVPLDLIESALAPAELALAA
jgi:hypothetical protein